METDTKTIERIVKLMKQLSNTEYLSEIKKDRVRPEDIEKLPDLGTTFNDSWIWRYYARKLKEEDLRLSDRAGT